jgi:hypothetical protein
MRASLSFARPPVPPKGIEDRETLRYVIPAKAGIQSLADVSRTQTAWCDPQAKRLTARDVAIYNSMTVSLFSLDAGWTIT